MKNLLLYTSDWNNQVTFKLLPTSPDCVFVEGIFDPSSKTLVLFSFFKKEAFHMIPKIDDNGDVIRKKGTNDYKQERRTLQTFYEHYITNKEEIESFIKSYCINSDTFDFTKYLN